jgi:hypothetical protein
MSRLIKVKLVVPAGTYLFANRPGVSDASGQWARKLNSISANQVSVEVDRSFTRGGFILAIDDLDATFKTMMADATNRKIYGSAVTVYVYKPDGVTLADTIVATVFEWKRKDGVFTLSCVQEFVGLLGTIPQASTWKYTSVDSGATWGGGHTVWLNKWSHEGGPGVLTVVDAVGAGGGPAVVENDCSYLLEGYITVASGGGVSIYVGDTLAGKITTTGAFSYQLVRVTAITATTIRFVPDDGCTVSLESAMSWIPIGGVAKYWKMYKLIDPDGAFEDANYVGGGGGSTMFSPYMSGWTHDSAVAASSNPVTALAAILAASGLTLVDSGDFEGWCTTNSWLHNGKADDGITTLKEYLEEWAASFDAWWRIGSDGKVYIKHIDWASVTADATLSERHFKSFSEDASMGKFTNRLNAKFNYDLAESKWLNELTVDSIAGDYLPATSPKEKDAEFYFFDYVVGVTHPATGWIKFLDHPLYTASGVMDLGQYEQLALGLFSVVDATHRNQIGDSGKYLIIQVAPGYSTGDVTLKMIRLWGV